jgi:long-chain fatty acid transport protein
MRNLIALIAVLLPAAALASGYVLPNTNPRDEGMAGANVANAVGPEAAFTNMSALAGREGLGVSLSGSLIYLRADWTDGVDTVSTVPKGTFPPNFNLTYGGKLPNGMGWGAGLAVAVQGGGLVHWPSHWAGRTRIQEVTRSVLTAEFGAAFQPIEQIKLGGSFVYYSGSEKLKQILDFGASEGEAQLSTKGSGKGYSVSAEITPVKDLPLRFGVVYRHQALLNLEGDAHFQAVPAGFQTSGLIDQKVTHKLMFPNLLTFGASYDTPLPGLTVNLAATYFRWSVYKEDVFAGVKGTTIVLAQNFEDTMTYRIGAEYALIPALKVRAGALRDNSPQPTTTLSPSVPKGAVTSTQLGAGYQITKELQVNVAWEHAFYDEVSASGSEAFKGTYNPVADVWVLGLQYMMK